MADPYKVFGDGWAELFDSVWWHSGIEEPTHDAPDGSGYLQRGWDGTQDSAIHGEWWLRRRGRWVRFATGGGVVDIGAFGGIADVRYGIASTVSGNPIITLAGLTATDVGKHISLRAAGAGSRALTTVHISLATGTTTIAADAAIAATTIQVASSSGFVANDAIKIGSGTLRFESAVVLSIPDGTHITLKAGLKLAHTAVQADVVAHATGDHFTCSQTLTNADLGHYIEVAGAGVAGGILRGEIGDVGAQIGSALAAGDYRLVLPGYAIADTAITAGTATIGGDQLITTIVAVSGSSVTLAVAPSTTLSQSNAMWYTPNNAALTAALLAGTGVLFPEQAIGNIYGFDSFTLTDEDDTLLLAPGVAIACTGTFALDANVTRIHAYSSGAIIRGFDPQHATFRYWGPNGPYLGTQPRCVQIGVTPGKAVTANELWSVAIDNEVRAVHATGLGVGRSGVGVDTFVMKHVRVTNFHFGVGTGIDVTGGTQTVWATDTSVYATTGDDGAGGGFGRGAAIRLAGDPADPSGAVTANWWHGGVLQNFLYGFQVGNPGPNGNVTTTTIEGFVIESQPIRDAMAFNMPHASNCLVRDNHFEGTAFEDGSLSDTAHISLGFQIGAGPKNGTTTRITSVAAGGVTVPVVSTAGFASGDQVFIGNGTLHREAGMILAIVDGTHFALTEPLKFAHSQVSTTVNGTATLGTNVIPVVSTAGFNIGDTIVINPGGPREEFGTIFAFPTATSIQIYNPPLIFTHTAVQADVVAQSEVVEFPRAVSQTIWVKDNKEIGGVAIMFRADYARGLYIRHNNIVMENVDPVHAPGLVIQNRQLGGPSVNIYLSENDIDIGPTGLVIDDVAGLVLNENHIFTTVTNTYDPHFWYYGTGHWLRLQGTTTCRGLFQFGVDGEGDGDGANPWDLTRIIGLNAGWTWTTPDGGFTPNWYIDGGAFTILPKYAATAVHQDRFTGLTVSWNVWDAAGLASVTTNWRMDLRTLSHNPVDTVLSCTYRGHYLWEGDDEGQLWLGAETLGPAILYGTGDPNGVRVAPPSSVYHRTDDGTYWLKVSGTGNTVWSLIAAGGPFVPTARTVFGMTPIRINSAASATLAADITISALEVTNATAGIAPIISAASTLLWSSGGTTSAWATLATIGIVPTSRVLTTTTPIRIDGGASADLSANRTISITVGTEGQVLTTLSGVATWATPAGGFVPTSRTVQGTAPIQIDGVNSAVDLSANRTWSVAAATTGALGVIQLTDDLAGTGAAPDVVAATGASDIFLVRCTDLNFAGAGVVFAPTSLIVTTTGGMLVSSTSTILITAVNDLDLSSNEDVTIDVASGHSITNSINGVAGLSLLDFSGTSRIALSNHTIQANTDFSATDEVQIIVNGTAYWVALRTA